jgi:hypothetical protein
MLTVGSQIFNIAGRLLLPKVAKLGIINHLRLFLFDCAIQILAVTHYYVPISRSRRFIEKIYALKGIKLTYARPKQYT